MMMAAARRRGKAGAGEEQAELVEHQRHAIGEDTLIPNGKGRPFGARISRLIAPMAAKQARTAG